MPQNNVQLDICKEKEKMEFDEQRFQYEQYDHDHILWNTTLSIAPYMYKLIAFAVPEVQAQGHRLAWLSKT